MENTQRLPIKGLSLNSAYRGRRFTTPELKQYKLDIIKLLKPIEINRSKKLFVKYKFGVSSKNSDLDNLTKCVQDVLAESYGFNDKLIYKIDLEKIDVKKGSEFIEFSISHL